MESQNNHTGAIDTTLNYYNVIEAASSLVLTAIKSMKIDPTHVFNIVDYGSADGKASMPLWYQVVKYLRETHGDLLPVLIAYEDLPGTDFESLFKRLQGLLQMPGNRSYLQEFCNVYVTACGRSFYNQCFPTRSVHFGFSACAMQWLQRKPCDLPDTFLVHISSCEEGRRLFAEQAARDWESNLLKRAEELAPDGHMVLVASHISDDGTFSGSTRPGCVNLWKMMTSIWKRFVDNGKITEEEFVNTNKLVYFRTKKEFRAPFQSQESPVVKAGLSLVSLETKVIECEISAQWEKEGGDGKEYAKNYTSMMRSWGDRTFYNGLSQEGPSQEKHAIVDAFYNEIEEEVAAAPDQHVYDLVECCIHIKKGPSV